MSEWTVVTVIVTLIGLTAAVIKPLISLNSVITRLTEAVNILDSKISGLTEKNSEAHGRIWVKVQEHEEVLCGHETRLMLIENKAAGK